MEKVIQCPCGTAVIAEDEDEEAPDLPVVPEFHQRAGVTLEAVPEVPSLG